MTDTNPAFIMPRSHSLCWIFTVLLLTACGGDSVRDTAQLEVKPQRQPLASVVRKPPVTDTVKSYGLADDQAGQHLLNADTSLQAGDMDAALKQLDLINTAELTPEQRSKFQLLDAQLALSMGDAEHALQKLVNARPGLLSDADKIVYYQSLAFSHSLLGDVLPAVSARIRLGNLLTKPEQQQANISSILDMLSVLPSDSLNGSPETNRELTGWLELARILKQRDQSGVDIGSQVAQWRLNNPNHPANAEFLQAYLAPQPTPATANAVTQNPPQSVTNGPSIAVLLPASGTYATAAKAIKAGLAAAHRLASSSSPQLPLKFYDSEQGDISDTYKQALAEGAKQVIGPLIKEQIQALAFHTELTVPVLALNHVDNLSKANLYQFGLSPLDDAQQLVAKARHDGRQSAVLLMPNNSQGQRIGNYLATAWQGSGGSLAGSQSYDPKLHDIGTMLNALVTTPDGLNVQKTPQAVLLSASPDVARELAPQLKYHQASDLAVYAMPNIYSGRQNPTEDAELGQFNFCDIPWLFPGSYDGPLSQSALQSVIQELPENNVRLLALGIDAYNLLGQLGQLASAPFAGATGRLGLNGENRITRKLVCAQFKGGVPVANGFVE
jgi:outer membrane PBP1 activator LpoA protein